MSTRSKTHGVLSFVYGQYCITGMLRPYIVQILNELTTNGLQINLDEVVLNNLDLSLHADQIDLRGMSARRAQFSDINMRYLKLDEVDFAGATFTNTNLALASLCKANIADAVFSNVQFSRTLVCELTGNQAGILAICAKDSEIIYLAGQRISTEKSILYGAFVSATPDTDGFTLPAPRNLPAKSKKP